MTETVLIVDDEESVRRTFHEWLTSARFGDLRVYAVGDAESALRVANEQPVDLAVLDWNLGTGNDGLQLLEDLAAFHPDVVAILVTGFANQATPLDALRKGVRDYLDKNQDLNRETFLDSVRRQLDRLRPAKRQRDLTASLVAFREAVEKILPLVRTAAAVNDPVPLPSAVRSLLRLLTRATRAADGVIVVRHAPPDGTESTVVYDTNGESLPTGNVTFSRSLAATVMSFQEPVVMTGFDPATAGALDLLPVERNRRSVLAAPLPVGSNASVVLELFDHTGDGFTDADRALVAAAAEVGAELIRQAMAERQTNRLLVDAVEVALRAGTDMELVMSPSNSNPMTPPSPEVMDRLRLGMAGDVNAVIDADTTLQLGEAVRGLAVRHGPTAVRYCVSIVSDLRRLLDEVTGSP